MRKRWSPLAGILLILAPLTLAHRLDECLQAVRIAVGTDHVAVELDVTPGMEVAKRILPVVDLDHDGHISALEAEAYADLVRSSLELEVNGRRERLESSDQDFPTVEELRAGEGTIRLVFGARWKPLTPGAHQLLFRNSHQTNQSAYLVNALVPEDPRVEVTAQDRDVLQRQCRLSFTVQAPSNQPPARVGAPGSR